MRLYASGEQTGTGKVTMKKLYEEHDTIGDRAATVQTT
jgi:hypothetical protein